MIRVTQQGNPNNIRLVGTKLASTDNLPIPRRTSEYVTRKGALYINEFPKGRELTFRYHPHGRATYDWGVVTRNERTPLRASATWICEPHNDNISDARLDQAHQATFKGARRVVQQRVQGRNERRVQYVQNGGLEYRFTTSGCGLDSYKVTFSFRRGSLDYREVAEITVRKRLNGRYVVMQNVRRTPRTIQWVVDQYADDFGIDLVLPRTPNGQLAAPQSIPHQAVITEQALKAALPGYNNRGNRDLWIVVVNRLAGGALGWGGQNMAALELHTAADTARDYAGIRARWRADGHGNMDQWLDRMTIQEQGQPARALNHAERRLYRYVALGNGGVLVKNMIRNTMLHEVAHALGAVPQNGEAGGRQQPGWHHAQQAGHCTTRACSMWWEADRAAAMPPLTRNHRKFDGYFRGDIQENCALYLAASNLADIRNYPQ